MSLLLKSSSLQAKAVARSGRRSVRAAAGSDNVTEAREWIGNWKAKQTPRTPSWFPGSDLPDHLDGSLPGDYGFDPLSLGVEPVKLKWYVQAELQNGRWAMLGVLGILFPDLLGGTGLVGPAGATPWYDAGKYTYFASPDTLFGLQMLLFAWVEIRRYQDMVKPGSANQDPIFPNNKLPAGNAPGYPGGIFDPLGYSKGPDFETLKVKELKNGRLAMLAFAGFVVQYKATGLTPLGALGAHLADPWNTTVWSNKLHIPL